MSTKDYGEPWKVSRGHIFDCGDATVVHYEGVPCEEEADRIVACVNACAGLDNPESALAAAREALRIAVGFCFYKESEVCQKITAALTLLAPERKDTT